MSDIRPLFQSDAHESRRYPFRPNQKAIDTLLRSPSQKRAHRYPSTVLVWPIRTVLVSEALRISSNPPVFRTFQVSFSVMYPFRIVFSLLVMCCFVMLETALTEPWVSYSAGGLVGVSDSPPGLAFVSQNQLIHSLVGVSVATGPSLVGVSRAPESPQPPESPQCARSPGFGRCLLGPQIQVCPVSPEHLSLHSPLNLPESGWCLWGVGFTSDR